MSNLKDIKNSANWGFETRQVQIGQEQPDPATDARAVPIYASTSFVFHNSQHAADRFGLRDAGNIYGRLTNPTQDIFEQRIASLEGGVAALATSSGAAAINYTLQALAKSGEHIVASKTIYGGTYNLLAHTLPLTSGITTTFVDPEEEGSFEAAITDKTKAIYVETLGNPNSNIADLEELANTSVMVICAGAKSILDLGLTLEYLETHGVTVIGYGTDELPAFYTRKSGFGVDYELDTPEQLAKAFHVKRELGLRGGLLVTNPIPEEYSMDKAVIDKAIAEAVEDAKKDGIHGKATTPYLLAKIKDLTGGDSLDSNIQLVFNNARLGAQAAVELAKLEK